MGKGGKTLSGQKNRVMVVLGFQGKGVEAYVLGEHGEDQVLVFSGVMIGSSDRAIEELKITNNLSFSVAKII